MKTGVLIFCSGSTNNNIKALRKELKNFEIISFKYKKEKNLSKDQAEIEEARARNRAILELESFDNLIMLDESEFIFAEDAEKIAEALSAENVSLVLARRILYAGENSCYTHDSHAPIVGVNPKKVKFYLKRCARADGGTYLNDVVVHDFSEIDNPKKRPKIICETDCVSRIIRECLSASVKKTAPVKRAGKQAVKKQIKVKEKI